MEVSSRRCSVVSPALDSRSSFRACSLARKQSSCCSLMYSDSGMASSSASVRSRPAFVFQALASLLSAEADVLAAFIGSFSAFAADFLREGRAGVLAVPAGASAAGAAALARALLVTGRVAPAPGAAGAAGAGGTGSGASLGAGVLLTSVSSRSHARMGLYPQTEALVGVSAHGGAARVERRADCSHAEGPGPCDLDRGRTLMLRRDSLRGPKAGSPWAGRCR